MSKRCSATKRDGTPCRAWAVKGSDPPLCGAHGGGARPPGAPAGNQNAESHGFYTHTTSPPPTATITEIVRDLADKQRRLSQYIDERLDDNATPNELAALLALHAQTASRLGRLLRDQRALSGDAADGMAAAIAKALDELSNELGVNL